MIEQELYNEYRKSDCKSFTDFLINKIAELEKENAELKSELTKAKEIIEKLMFTPDGDVSWYDLCDKAEQFLKENK